MSGNVHTIYLDCHVISSPCTKADFTKGPPVQRFLDYDLRVHHIQSCSQWQHSDRQQIASGYVISTTSWHLKILW